MNKVITFLLGAGVGAGVAYYVTKTKYEGIIQDEIDSVKSVYAKKNPQTKEEPAKEDEAAATKDDIEECEDIINKNGYVNYSDMSKKEKKEEPKMASKRPYVIAPGEFDMMYEYETSSLTYYANGVLTDENDEPISNVDELVGSDSLKHFGEYEEDSVFVRNDVLKCDYEILRDNRNFEEE